jgi:hypothetical protein
MGPDLSGPNFLICIHRQTHNPKGETAMTHCNLTTPLPAQTRSTIAMPSQPIEAPSAWMNNGTSPAEFLLASSFLLISQSVIIWSIAGLIHALKTRK